MSEWQFIGEQQMGMLQTNNQCKSNENSSSPCLSFYSEFKFYLTIHFECIGISSRMGLSSKYNHKQENKNEFLSKA